MGRRPNPLVVEFFERGAKLEDNSNRYAHSCKRCSEEFPKGRSDSLVSHLLRKCPNVTHEDRQWVFHQIQSAPESLSNNIGHLATEPRPEITQDDSQSPPAFSGAQQQSALDTLAEVSRHHLDYSSQRTLGEALHDHRTDDSINEQDLIDQLRQSAGPNIPVTAVESRGLHLFGTDAERQQVQQNPNVSLVASNALAESPLVKAASAANQQLEHEAQTRSIDSLRDSSLVDPQLDDIGTPSQGQLMAPYITDNGSKTTGGDAVADLRLQKTFGNLSVPVNAPMPGFGLLQRKITQKARGHFNDTRRKEVQEIRKQGACIRCRMLKKPCSGETPCSTCRNVESARLWKGSCIRTRLADEFSLWSANLFHSTAKIEVPAGTYRREQHPLPGRIEARFLATSNLCMNFAAKICSGAKPAMNPDLRNGDATDRRTMEDIWLLDEADAMSDKLEAYLMYTAEMFIAAETSSFMTATLQRGQNFYQTKKDDEQAGKGDKSHEQKPLRACYNLQNELLKNVIELWILTRLLTVPDTHVLQLRYDPTKVKSNVPEPNWVDGDQDSPTIEISASSDSFRLIKSQLMAAIESRCNKLSKIVMNEHERRLLQRQQTSRFESFLSAVILLNCVERMTGFYRSFDTGSQQTYNKHVTDSTEPEVNDDSTHSATEAAWGNMSYHVPDHPQFWPLDIPPFTLWSQGAYFADLLTMLLRMRALPPKTAVNPDGTLVVIQDFSIPIHFKGRSAQEPRDDQLKAAAAWLDPLKLSVSDLLQKRDGEYPAKTGSLDEWDMRFVAKVLLPERMK